MASSRSLRRSRLPSPVGIPVRGAAPVRNEALSTRNGESLSVEWEEPPLRTPAPSFEDHKGLDRQGVVEFFQPLGTFPNQRVKLRLKAHEPPRRSTHLKNGDPVAVVNEEMSTPDPIPPQSSRRSEPRRSDDKNLKVSLPRERDEDPEYTPKGIQKPAPSKPLSTQSPQYGTPLSRASAGQVNLKVVVDSAVSYSYEKEDPVLGLALKKLYEDSLSDPRLYHVVEAILTRSPTGQQQLDFQSYMKIARKQVRADNGISKRGSGHRGSSSNIMSMSPSTRTRPGVSSTKGFNDVPGTKNYDNNNLTSPHHSSKKSTRHNTKSVPGSSISPNHQVPSTRARRSDSSSSLSSVSSSLSSVDQEISIKPDLDLSSSSSTLQASSTVARRKGPLGSAGPKMGVFTTSNAHRASSKRSLAAASLSREDEELAAKRQKFQKKSFNDYHVKDSDVRTLVHQSSYLSEPLDNATAPISQLQVGPTPRVRSGSQRPDFQDDSDELGSPISVHSDFLCPPHPGMGPLRRGTTPTHLGRPPKASKKSARVKMSPLKKRNGVVAGMARPSGARPSPIGSGNSDGDGMNSDECVACGGTGKLLCCDGCTRSYHFTCLEPPTDVVPDGEWLCEVCRPRLAPMAFATASLPPTVFAPLTSSISRKNPAAFNLPLGLRGFFEDVVTGDDGEYEEAVPSKAKSRGGYDMPADTLKLKDARDNVVLCYKCGLSAMGDRDIIDCDFCNSNWHIDCVDPPLANPPKRTNKGVWRCPNHMDPDIVVPRSAAGKAYKLRRPREVRVVRPAVSRGIKNNGVIEVESESSDEEDEPPGTIFRIPALAIKLDFMDRIKRSNLAEAKLGKHQRDVLKAKKHHHRQTAHISRGREMPSAFDSRSLAERQAALDLAHFAQPNPKSQLNANQLEVLIGALIAEAPKDVVPPCSQNIMSTNMENSIKVEHDADSPQQGILINDMAAANAEVTAINKAAHGANQMTSVEMRTPSIISDPTAAAEELDNYLKLDAIVQAKIAALRAVALNTQST